MAQLFLIKKTHKRNFQLQIKLVFSIKPINNKKKLFFIFKLFGNFILKWKIFYCKLINITTIVLQLQGKQSSKILKLFFIFWH